MNAPGEGAGHAPWPAAPAAWERPSPGAPPAAELDAEFHRLLTFAEGSWVPGGGFGRLDDDGQLVPDVPVETYGCARITYSFALGSLAGRSGDGARVDHGMSALVEGGLLHDDDHGGWYASVAAGPEGGAAPVVVDPTKAAYAHAFVVLAASSAAVAGRPGADDLLAEALGVVEEYFWDESAGVVRESFSPDWSVGEDYRGANANMHSVEAFLAAADALGEHGRVWRERAGRIVERIIHGTAREARWLLPEHYDVDLQALRDYNTDDRAHPFRPYGVTPGHLFEWSRLCVHLYAAEVADGRPSREWLVSDAVDLYARAVEIGWAADGTEGFVYTTDFAGAPVARARMHWVLAEAVGAAAVLHQLTGQASYARDHSRWWAFAERHFIDRQRGSWYHELDAELRVSTGTWSGKPDVYHALQATLVPRLPLAPTFARALRQVG